MNPFESRWKTLFSTARRAPAPDNTMPAGFVARILALSRAARDESPDMSWLNHSRQFLGLAIVFLAFCAFLEYSSRPASASIRPPIEIVVLDVISTL